MPPGLGDQFTQTLNSIMGAAALPSQLQGLYGQLYPMQLAEPLAQQGLDTTLANQQYQDTLAQLGIQGGALAREQQYLPQQQALAKQLLGLSGQELGLQGQRLGIQGKSLDITQTQEQQAADQARRSAWSGATARGATNTMGFRQGLGDIQNNLANQLAQLGLSRQGLGISQNELGLQQQRLGVQGQEQNISDILQSGSLADQLAQLGLSRTIAGQSLQNSLGQAALNAQSGVVNTGLGQLNSLAGAAQGIPGYAGQAGAITNYGQTPPPLGYGPGNPDYSPTKLLPGRQ